MHSFKNFIVRLIPNHPPPLETRIWKLVVRALVTTWILFLAKELKFLLPFSTLSEMEGLRRPKVFRPYLNLRAVLDCTEFYIKKPSRPSSQRQTYSGYKSGNTFKLLVSLSSICHINFISKLYTGSISDKSIVQKSGFLDALQNGDAVMTDKVRIF